MKRIDRQECSNVIQKLTGEYQLSYSYEYLFDQLSDYINSSLLSDFLNDFIAVEDLKDNFPELD